MPSNLASISNNTWTTLVSRLTSVGVFADEERQFPGIETLRHELAEFGELLSANGYGGGPIAIEEIDQPENGVSFLVFDQTIHGDVRSANIAWKNEYWQRWHDKVTERVNDWLLRLSKLKALMESWLLPGMTIVDRPPTLMNEELMRKFGVGPAAMPTFDVQEATRRVMRVQPKGLWIIGANGRVDLITVSASYILVDKAANLQPPNWQFYTSTNRHHSIPFDQHHFVSLLG